jgi:hypothetical protein
LIAASRAPLTALAVPRARVRLRAARGQLALLAQAPERLRATVTVAGQELASLALHERGYELIWKLDSLEPGFYAGPPADCAVATVLGVPLAPRELVAVILGGAPLPSNVEILAQRWDPRRARELLRIRTPRDERELAFAWRGDAWVFTGATAWRIDGAGRATETWTLEHTAWLEREGARVPSQTTLSRPDGRRRERVEITLLELNAAPSWAANEAAEPGDDAPPETDPPDGWEEAGGWEGEAPPGEPLAPQPAAAAGKEPAPKQPATGSPAARIPARWHLGAGGLPARGDLCRGR